MIYCIASFRLLLYFGLACGCSLIYVTLKVRRLSPFITSCRLPAIHVLMTSIFILYILLLLLRLIIGQQDDRSAITKHRHQSRDPRKELTKSVKQWQRWCPINEFGGQLRGVLSSYRLFGYIHIESFHFISDSVGIAELQCGRSQFNNLVTRHAPHSNVIACFVIRVTWPE